MELLDIAQAAAFLQVSATSLRRWTNAGLLPCYRLGGRHERRFRRTDLLTFLERGALPTATVSHLCGLYRGPLTREHQAAAFLAAGLAAGSACILLAEPRARAGILARLRKLWPAVRQFVTAGRLAFARYESRSTVQLEAWERQFEAAATSVRVVGDVSGGPLARRPVADLVEYERRYDELSRRFAVSSLCLYDAARLSGVDTAHLLTGHDNLYRPPAMPRSVG